MKIIVAGVKKEVAEGLPVTAVPGPSAADVALVLSGLPTSSWTFLGFPPRKPGALRRLFEDEARSPHTLVLYESPFRVGATLQAALDVLGDREAAVCIELTKLHEEVLRLRLGEAAALYADHEPRGEYVLVVAGAPEPDKADDGEDALARALALAAAGLSARDAALR